MKRLRIAQISTLVEPVTESSKNGLSQIVYYLTQELVDLGHDVTLYAPMSSSTNGRLVALTDLDTAAETILGKVLPVAAAFADWRNFDIIHDHTRFYSTLFAHLLPVPIVSTVHHPAEFDELHWNYPHDQYSIYFKAIWQRLVQSMNTVCVSQFQRAGFGEKAEMIYNGIPLDSWPNPNFSSGQYLAFLGAINETKGTMEAIQASLLAGETILIAGTTDEHGEVLSAKHTTPHHWRSGKVYWALRLRRKAKLSRPSQGGLDADSVGRSAADSCSRNPGIRDASDRLESRFDGRDRRRWRVRFFGLFDRGNGRSDKGCLQDRATSVPS